jgi:hypothetical protein
MKRIDVTKEIALALAHCWFGASRLLIRSLMLCDILAMLILGYTLLGVQ